MKKKREFSKILWVVAMIHAMALTIYTMIAILITGDISPLNSLIPSVFAELAAATGFYYSKAKAENLIKLRKQHGSEVFGESGASDT